MKTDSFNPNCYELEPGEVAQIQQIGKCQCPECGNDMHFLKPEHAQDKGEFVCFCGSDMLPWWKSKTVSIRLFSR